MKIELYKGTSLKNTITSSTANDGSYTWSTVDASLEDGTDYKVRISDYNNSNIYGESAQFKIEPPITVTNPTSSTVWTKGQSAAITWTSKGASSRVSIQLYKGTNLWGNIDSYEVNDGSFTWSNVPTSLVDGTDYKVKIIDYYSSNLFAYSDEFEIKSGSVISTKKAR